MAVSFMQTSTHAETEYIDENIPLLIDALGVMDQEYTNSSEEPHVTRGEFAGILARLVNMPLSGGFEQLFSDVDANNENSAAIAAVYKMGVMVGNGSGNFCPDEKVTAEQAVKALVYILGYSFKAEKHGGYPAGYLHEANSLGLPDGLSINRGEKITRKELAALIRNSLSVELIDLTEISGTDAVYGNAENETILTRYMDIDKFEGVISEIDGRSILSRNAETDKGQVKIGMTAANYKDCSIVKYLGCRVEAYVRDINGVKELVCAFPVKRNRELTINAGALELDNPKFTLTNFCYEDNFGKLREAEMTKELRFVYNGAYDYDFDKDDLRISSGYVSLIDHNNDSVYDVCMVWDFEEYVFESAKKDSIACFYNKTLSFNEDTQYRVQLRDGKCGNRETLSDLAAWDILNVAKSKDGELVTIIVSRGGISGTVDAISSENGRETVTVEGIEYKVSPLYTNLPANSGKVSIKNGLKSEFYFNATGEIAAIYAKTAESDRFGVLLNAGKDKGIKNKYKMKIYSSDGKTKVYRLRDRVKYSAEGFDEKVTSAETVVSDFTDGTGAKQEVICYSLDENGYIGAVKKAVNATEKGYNLDKFSLDFHLGNVPGDTTAEHFRFQDATSTFGLGERFETQFHITANTIVFYAPEKDGRIDEDSINVTDLSFFDPMAKYENISVYECDDTYVGQIVLYTPEVTDENAGITSEYFIAVEKVYSGRDDDGYYVPVIRGMYRGAMKDFEYISVDGTVPEKGSIIRHEEKLSGELLVKKSNVLFSPSVRDKYVEMNSLGGGTYLPLVWMSYGRLYRRNGAAISVYTGSDKPRANYIPAGCPIYKIDKDNHITKSSEAELVESSSNPSELYDGSRVIFNNRYQYVREMWILED